MEHEDPACAVAHGEQVAEGRTPTLVAVFASQVAGHLLRYARDCGYSVVLLEPDGARDLPDNDVKVVRAVEQWDGDTDVVLTDHHRDELGPVLKEALETEARWVGIMGNPRHEGPHVRALKELGVPDEEIARVRRPIGLNIGSRTPPEIAIATLAGLIADRRGRPGGFAF